ncbi:uncharacterized protein AMSG_08699 [Thecamonas trahens ATCC 50062]|uniref:Uncharacterized protein n=1 Tax=Thecamonas trahens ATCC 50062 TaxID=461836 RepID=A0A0L0DKI8_THETB|nr:hypothetical protein AMSG_08699 [Thecamonas trahens ATCC 50062]KNC52807.1 hypothetical protein AMSG_08699 [Thecamonas trahens ATCC 50062]|eukprot:XP_013755116.1 hypothetical protein AMSG_08699 [Thecamonas trahens ATCC 50062]
MSSTVPRIRPRRRRRESLSLSEEEDASVAGGFDGLNVRPRNLEERHQVLNYLFGFAPTAKSVTRSSTPRLLRDDATSSPAPLPAFEPAASRSIFGFGEASLVTVGNVVWLILFGWWIALLYLALAGVLAISWVGRYHASLLWHLSSWYLWPFGRALERVGGGNVTPSLLPAKARLYGSTVSIGSAGESARAEAGEGGRIDAAGDAERPLSGLGGRSSSLAGINANNGLETQAHNNAAADQGAVEALLGKLVYYVLAFPVLALVHVVVSAMMWMSVVMIPMFELNMRGLKALYEEPLTLFVGESTPRAGAQIVMCTYKAADSRYFYYERFGVNVVLLNMFPFVGLTLILGYLGEHVVFLKPISTPGVIFVSSLLSTVPIAYFIGMAISSISAQSTFAVGAVLNATFGSIIELILYAKLLLSGYSSIVKAAVTGSLLGVMLFMPGLSMVVGGLKFKSQRFNATAAGVSSVLLLIAIIGAFSPTVFYNIYGTYSLSCTFCAPTNSSLACTGCAYIEGANELNADPIYQDRARPLSYVCAAILPMAYFVGLLFTLKTHKHIYEVTEFSDDDSNGSEEGGGHNAPAWSNLVCISVLLSCTILFALVSETLVDSIQPILASLGISELFLGLTLLALVPNTAEFANAVQFALQNNVMLSMEIGASAAAQITLIQMPVLTFFSAIVGTDDADTFTLIFPQLHLFAVIFGVIILNYNSLDGQSNYFQGAAFCIVYAALVATFYFVPDVPGIN